MGIEAEESISATASAAPEVVTYCLRGEDGARASAEEAGNWQVEGATHPEGASRRGRGQPSSDRYYAEVGRFAEEALAEAQGQVGGLLQAFRRKGGAAAEGEGNPGGWLAAFEALTLGVLWRVYAGRASGQAGPGQRLLARLAQWREQHKRLKPAIDGLRGALGGLLLEGGPARGEAPLTLETLEGLLGWLAATGDFAEEVKRLRAWGDFLAGLPAEEATRHLEAVMGFATWFERRGLEVLGRYTPQVERFLAERGPAYRWREDRVFCGRQRAEYHLNMVGTEMMNRAFREAFLQTGRKAVLLPPCMRAKPDGVCKARSTPHGELCAGCTPSCRVHQATRLGEKHGFAVFILPHELSVFGGGASPGGAAGQTGVVGVSCPLTNVTGGWQTHALGIPAQGLLLDYCGCVWHWRPQGGIPTDINFKQLLKVVGEGAP